MRGFLSDSEREYRRQEESAVEFLDVTCVKQTPKAICVRIKGRDHWLPQAAVHDDSEVYAMGHEGKLVVKGWFAEKNGWSSGLVLTARGDKR